MLLVALVDYRRWAIHTDKVLKPGDVFGTIKVEDIYGERRFLDELPPQRTAIVTLSGDGVDDLTRGTILEG